MAGTNVYKEVWTFSGLNDRWTEVFYRTAPNLAGINPVPLSVLNARLAFLATCYSVERIRFSQVGSPRVTDLQTVNMIGTRAIASVGIESGKSALVHNLVDVPRLSKRQYRVRGLSSQDVQRTVARPIGTSSVVYDGLFKSWLIAVAAAGYIILRRFTPVELAYTPPNVRKVDGSAANGSSDVTLSAPLVFAAGDRIRFRRMNKKDLPGMNGAFDIVKVAGNVVTVNYETPENLVITPNAGNAVIERFHTDAVIDGSKYNQPVWSARHTKNASIGSRGSQFARRSRSQA